MYPRCACPADQHRRVFASGIVDRRIQHLACGKAEPHDEFRRDRHLADFPAHAVRSGNTFWSLFSAAPVPVHRGEHRKRISRRRHVVHANDVAPC